MIKLEILISCVPDDVLRLCKEKLNDINVDISGIIGPKLEVGRNERLMSNCYKYTCFV